MQVNHIPSFEERPLVHSETVIIDISLMLQTISESALQQLSSVRVPFEKLLVPPAMMCQHMVAKITDINTFRANINAIDSTFDKSIYEFYQMSLMSGAIPVLKQEEFFKLYYDTIYKVYHIYHFFFCNFMHELRTKCNVLGFSNIHIVLHTVNVANGVGRLAFGCYVK